MAYTTVAVKTWRHKSPSSRYGYYMRLPATPDMASIRHPGVFYAYIVPNMDFDGTGKLLPYLALSPRELPQSGYLGTVRMQKREGRTFRIYLTKKLLRAGKVTLDLSCSSGGFFFPILWEGVLYFRLTEASVR